MMSANALSDIKAYEIIDNRGMPTIRVAVCIDNQIWGHADVPSGSSTGSYEAMELRDGDVRFRGKGVLKAIQNIHDIILPELRGQDAGNQKAIDTRMLELDGSENKSKLGGNAILGVSLAVAQAAANACGKPLYNYLNTHAHVLPVPQACLLNGGVHAGNDLDIQEFCVMPIGARTFAESVQILCETFYSLKDILLDQLGKSATNSGEDGGFAPPISSTRQAMDFLCEAVQRSGYTDKVVYGLDFAASGYYHPEEGAYAFEGTQKTKDEMIAFIKKLLNEYPSIVSIEDPLHENDLEGMRILTDEFSSHLIIGDDMFATNIKRIQKGLEHGAGNATLCKVNQIGTLTEASDTVDFARQNNYAVVMSERSGETEDSVLSDISVAFNAGLFKTGGIRGSDRGANYNRFIEIERELGPAAVYAGTQYGKVTISG
ncbi:MAG: phosphopyruvate hydratase [Desulfobacterales bacterium]|jgi:enolase